MSGCQSTQDQICVEWASTDDLGGGGVGSLRDAIGDQVLVYPRWEWL